MAIDIILQYKSSTFSYSIRKSQFKGVEKYFINVYISCSGVFYQLAEKNNLYGAGTEVAAKKRIMKVLKEKCLGTEAESYMLKLPIFQQEGMQGELF